MKNPTAKKGGGQILPHTTPETTPTNEGLSPDSIRQQKREIMARVLADVEMPDDRFSAVLLLSKATLVQDFDDKVAYLYEQSGEILSHEFAIPLIERLLEFYRRTTPDEIEILSTRVGSRLALNRDFEPSAKRTYPGYVYLLQSPSGYYKIGRTSNPDDRIGTFHVKLPFEVEYIAVIQTDDMHELERQLHEQFAHRRVNGEWFNLSADDVEYIKRLAVDHE